VKACGFVAGLDRKEKDLFLASKIEIGVKEDKKKLLAHTFLELLTLKHNFFSL